MSPASIVAGSVLAFGVAATVSIAYLRKANDALEQKVLAETSRADAAARLERNNTQALEFVIEADTRVVHHTQEILREVEVRVPTGACALPPGWRVLHNAAADAPEAAASAPAGAASGPQEVGDR